MKYTAKALDNAIDLLLPSIKVSKNAGIVFNKPDLLKMVARDFFIKSVDSEWNPSFDERCAYYICQEAAIDLDNNGYFEFGDKEWSAE